MKLSIKEMVTGAMLMALAVVLSYPMFKILGSIGIDAVPAYFGAAFIGPMVGGLVGGFAHIISAMLTGFPYTLPVHIAVMLMMFVTCYIYGVVREKTNRYIASVVGVILNGPITLFVSAYMSQFLGLEFAGMAMFTFLFGPLLIASIVNVVIAEVLYSILSQVVKTKRTA